MHRRGRGRKRTRDGVLLLGHANEVLEQMDRLGSTPFSSTIHSTLPLMNPTTFKPIRPVVCKKTRTKVPLTHAPWGKLWDPEFDALCPKEVSLFKSTLYQPSPLIPCSRTIKEKTAPEQSPFTHRKPICMPGHCPPPTLTRFAPVWCDNIGPSLVLPVLTIKETILGQEHRLSHMEGRSPNTKSNNKETDKDSDSDMSDDDFIDMMSSKRHSRRTRGHFFPIPSNTPRPIDSGDGFWSRMYVVGMFDFAFTCNILANVKKELFDEVADHLSLSVFGFKARLMRLLDKDIISFKHTTLAYHPHHETSWVPDASHYMIVTVDFIPVSLHIYQDMVRAHPNKLSFSNQVIHKERYYKHKRTRHLSYAQGNVQKIDYLTKLSIANASKSIVFMDW